MNFEADGLDLTFIGLPCFPLDGAAFLADDSGMIAASPDSLPARDDHIKLLKERLEHYRKNPADTLALEQVKAIILSSR